MQPETAYIEWSQWTYATIHITLNRRNAYIYDNLVFIKKAQKLKQRELIGMEWIKWQKKVWFL